MADENLESRVGRFKVSIKCTHRKASDFAYLYYNTDTIEINAYICSRCLPDYTTFINVYKNAKTLQRQIDDSSDNFDEEEMCFRYE